MAKDERRKAKCDVADEWRKCVLANGGNAYWRMTNGEWRKTKGEMRNAKGELRNAMWRWEAFKAGHFLLEMSRSKSLTERTSVLS